jgi:hypothetical protein
MEAPSAEPQDADTDADICGICLEILTVSSEDKSSLRCSDAFVLGECNHSVCAGCFVDNVIVRNTVRSCPFCRASVTLSDHNHCRELRRATSYDYERYYVLPDPSTLPQRLFRNSENIWAPTDREQKKSALQAFIHMCRQRTDRITEQVELCINSFLIDLRYINPSSTCNIILVRVIIGLGTKMGDLSFFMHSNMNFATAGTQLQLLRKRSGMCHCDFVPWNGAFVAEE